MGTNIAARRAAKANRRKAIVAEKRKAEMFAGALTERIRRAAIAPIRHCLLPEALFETGIGTLILARGTTADQLAMGAFLIDVWCLGVKDALFQSVDAQDFEMYVDATDATQPLVRVEPSHARKLLRDVAVWADSIGFPHTPISRQWSGCSVTCAPTAAMQYSSSVATGGLSICRVHPNRRFKCGVGWRSYGRASAMDAAS